MADLEPVRKVTWDGKDVSPVDLAELARDLRAKFATFVPRTLVEFAALYTEPMYIAHDHSPKYIYCGRVRNQARQEDVILAGTGVNFVWEGTRARVTSIDGMSPGSGITYLFTFELVG